MPAASPGPVAAHEAPAPPAWVYVVQKGDTLLEIAHGLDVSLDEITRLNRRIEEPDLIEIGQQLRIPLALEQRDPALARPTSGARLVRPTTGRSSTSPSGNWPVRTSPVPENGRRACVASSAPRNRERRSS